MVKINKKRIKQIIALACIAAIVLLLALMPVIAGNNQETDGPTASILSGKTEIGNIDTTIIGGGTLADKDAVKLSVPVAVKLKRFLVSNGEKVTEGTPIASVDRVTVMTAVQQVQETLDYLSEEIEKADDVIATKKVSALAGGTVKTVYAKKGDSVQSVMLEHGALAVLSLDGLMAVDLETTSTLPVSSAVKVILSDGKTVSGKVASNLAGNMTVTVEDRSYAEGDKVQVTTEDGTQVGEGVLYIYSPWKATAYTGTVNSVNVKVGDKLSAGKTILKLEDLGQTAAYHQLVGQRQEYEELMLDLFKMYQTETLTAPCDGVVSGVDKESAQLLSDNGESFVLTLLANAPNGNDQILYSNYVAQVTTIAENGWVLSMNPQAMPIADYLQLAGLTVDPALLTQTVLFTQMDLPIFTLTDGAWTQVEIGMVGVGDIMLFASDAEGNLVWGVLTQKAENTNPPTNSGNDPGNNLGTNEQTKPGEQITPDQQTRPNGQTNSGSIQFPSGGDFSGIGGGMPQQEEVFTLYDLEMAQVATVTPQKEVTLEIAVDELDINALKLGMTAQVRVDALGGEKCTATITQIDSIGTNNGGSSKYTVELTMDRTENMLAGMNATAVIALTTTENVVTIPVAALVENENETVVYTGYNENKELLENPVAVKLGVSDGETVQILEGLDAGQTYYYAYYDTLEISDTPDFGGMGLFGR